MLGSKSFAYTPLAAKEFVGTVFTVSTLSITTPSLSTDKNPPKMYTKPWPPASTTPAFLSTGNCSGVWSRASCAAATTASHRTISSASSAMDSAFSQATLATVKIVPSVGFITAL